MSDIVIKAENIGKMYTIGHQAERGGYTALRDVLMQNARNLWNKTKDLATGKPIIQGDTLEEVWALKDVSFDIPRGEAVGIIGRNGAGKSTLLKVLSRITEPSTGRVTIAGRVASLLEVGTGFHPELTGRENIYLNGTILGMTRKEIKRKFDEIVDFADVGRFIDTPIKRYSSGMYVRLAFAVAAHLEPEILVVDEVLAVGDAAFQKKCLGKMGDVAHAGRTVLFVSHNMSAIGQLCSKSIFLESGEVVKYGETSEVIDAYKQSLRDQKIDYTTEINNPKKRRGEGNIRFTSITILDEYDNENYTFQMGDTVRFKLSYRLYKDMSGLGVNIIVYSPSLNKEVLTSTMHLITEDTVKSGTEGTVVVEWPCISLRPGEYPLYFSIFDKDMSSSNFDVVDDVTHPLVIRGGGINIYSNFTTTQSVGSFSIPSRLLIQKSGD